MPESTEELDCCRAASAEAETDEEEESAADVGVRAPPARPLVERAGTSVSMCTEAVHHVRRWPEEGIHDLPAPHALPQPSQAPPPALTNGLRGGRGEAWLARRGSEADARGEAAGECLASGVPCGVLEAAGLPPPSLLLCAVAPAVPRAASPRGDEARGDEARGDEARGDEARGDEARGDEARWREDDDGVRGGVRGVRVAAADDEGADATLLDAVCLSQPTPPPPPPPAAAARPFGASLDS